MNRHPNVLNRDASVLLVIDLQTAFSEVIVGWEDCIKHCRLLIQSARELGIPVIPTTQNTTRLGSIIPELTQVLGPIRSFDKLTFSCMGDPFISEAIRGARRQQIVLCGIETHICIAQTAMELQAVGYQPHVVADATGARSELKHQLGLERLKANNIPPTAAESVIYEWLGVAGTPEFRALLPYIKEAG